MKCLPIARVSALAAIRSMLTGISRTFARHD